MLLGSARENPLASSARELSGFLRRHPGRGTARDRDHRDDGEPGSRTRVPERRARRGHLPPAAAAVLLLTVSPPRRLLLRRLPRDLAACARAGDRRAEGGRDPTPARRGAGAD